jgi:anion-transporting  ArsA/GET3 family ATPase
MSRRPKRPELCIVVGAGGVGKTTFAAGLGVAYARDGRDVLVMTFDPSERLKDALGVGDAARDASIRVPLEAEGTLEASLLDAKRTFDRIVARYAPDEASRERITNNRFYRELRGSLAGILEYMAVERLFEVAEEGRHDVVILDTPPARQAMDFLGAPRRIADFLDSGAIEIALKPWFDERGRFRAGERFGLLGRGLERLLDRLVGIGLLRELAEFFHAFEPLYAGFRERAEKVEKLLRSPTTSFLLVTSPAPERLPDAMMFARTLGEEGHRLRAVVANRVHPEVGARPGGPGRELVAWLGRRDRASIARLRALLPPELPLIEAALCDEPPLGFDDLEGLARNVADAI